jgi:hypothetical protein
MSETPEKAIPSPHHPPEASRSLSRSAILWMAALILCLGTSAAFTCRNDTTRSTLETLGQPTAVGDRATYPQSENAEEVIQFEKRKLVLSATPDALRDSKMRRVARTDDGKYGLYLPAERATQLEGSGGPSWYIKAGPNLFINATVSEAPKSE